MVLSNLLLRFNAGMISFLKLSLMIVLHLHFTVKHSINLKVEVS